MTTAERDKAIFEARTKRNWPYKRIAEHYGVAEGTAWRVVHYMRKRRITTIRPSAEIQRRENISTDLDTWQTRLAAAAKRKRWLTVMHLSDIHFPYHDVRALALTYKIVEAVQPDVIVVGSDAFDLPTISRFDTDRDLHVDDWLDEITPYWNEFIGNIRKAAPDALLPFIVGNHDVRAINEIKKMSTPRIVMNHFIDTVRAGGDVLWLGDTGEVDIYNLTVAHGFKTTRHTAAASLQAYQHQRNLAVGHTHRPDFYTVRGAAYSVACVVGGCLCQLTPHYQQGRKHTDWQHGTMLGIVDTQGHNTALSNISYHHDDKTTWGAVGTQVIEVKS